MRTNPISRRWLWILAAVALAGCGGGEVEQDQGELDLEATPEGGMTASQATGAPDTTAEGLWRYLEAQNYTNWPLFPGKERYYAGTEPHGAILTTYVNPEARVAIEADTTVMPAGSILVKENYTPDTTLAAITIMYKHAGFAPAQGDWFWMRRSPDGTVDAQGRIQSCIECHGTRAANDYIMTADLQ